MKNIFHFSTSERNGIIALIVIIFILIFTPWIIDIIGVEEYQDYSEFELEIDSNMDIINSTNTKDTNVVIDSSNKYFIFDPNKINDEQWKLLGVDSRQIKIINNFKSKGGRFYKKSDLLKIYGFDKSTYNKIKSYMVFSLRKNQQKANKLFFFDPNNTSHSNWMKLGLNIKQINTINNYLKAGGVFTAKEDLKKIYGLNENTYHKLEPYIKIDTIYVKSKTDKKIKKDNKLLIEINSADSIILVNELYMKPYIASNIIKYRSLLGGFYSVNQLKEVYGMQYSYDKICNKIFVDTSLIKKMNINNISFKELNKNPYVSFQDTKAIFTYIKIMGKINNISELADNHLISKEQLGKMMHYFYVE